MHSNITTKYLPFLINSCKGYLIFPLLFIILITHWGKFSWDSFSFCQKGKKKKSVRQTAIALIVLYISFDRQNRRFREGMEREKTKEKRNSFELCLPSPRKIAPKKTSQIPTHILGCGGVWEHGGSMPFIRGVTSQNKSKAGTNQEWT